MSRRIRILEIVYCLSVEGPGGGRERFGIELSRALDPDRFDVTVCGLWNLGTPFEETRINQLKAEGMDVFTAAVRDKTKLVRSFWKAFGAIQLALSQRPADILHSHAESANVMAMMLKAGFKPPIIIRTVHSEDKHMGSMKPLHRLMLTDSLYPLLFDVEIGVSRSIVHGLNRRWMSRLLGRQAQYISNAIDLEKFGNIQVDAQAKRRSLNVPADAMVIGTLGRLSQEKGYSFLIEAAAVVLEHLPQAFFLIVGDGQLRNSLVEQARRMAIDSRVVFTGPRSDIEELLACMDLLVSPSLTEGLPTTIIESMACGVPVVATDIPGTRELIQDGVTGCLVPPANSHALAEAILTMLASASLREETAHRAGAAVKDFSIKAVARRYEALFQALLDSRAALKPPISTHA